MSQISAEKAKLLRAKRRLDPTEQYDQEEFDQAFKQDPFAAMSKIQEKQTRSQRNIEKQVTYFGHVIEPFNMRNEEDMGEVDAEGFFVFKRRKGEVRDAWLDSLGAGSQEQLMEGLQKKILQQGKIEAVNSKPEQAEDDQEEQDQQDDILKEGKPAKKVHMNNGQSRQADKQQPEEPPALNPSQIKYLLSELLPTKMHCASYLRQLKPQKRPQFKKNVRKSKMAEEQAAIDPADLEQYEKIMELCNLYIQQTGDHDIMTRTKEAIAKEIATGEANEQRKSESSESEKQKQVKPAVPTQQQAPTAKPAVDQDDIF